MMKDNESLRYEEALLQLAAGEAMLSSSSLYALSAPSSAEIQLFRDRWPTLSLDRRRKMIALLTESAEANFELDFNALFRVTMEDEDEQIRTLSIEGLWEDEEPTLVAPLVRTLRHDEGMSARAAAATSLGRFALLAELEELDERHAKLVRGALLESVHNDDEHLEVRRRAVESIAYLGEDCVREIIAAAYEQSDESMRISAVFAMGRSGDAVWSDTVQEALSSSNPAMRYEAARACGELEVKEAVTALIQLVSDPDREVQFAAIAALGQVGGRRARQALERCCRSADDVIRLVAEDALAELELGARPLDLFIYDPNTEHEEDEDEEIESED
jgi:HEAT repeat protein